MKHDTNVTDKKFDGIRTINSDRYRVFDNEKEDTVTALIRRERKKGKTLEEIMESDEMTRILNKLTEDK